MSRVLTNLAAILLKKEALRFGCIGVLNTVFGYLVFAICLLLGTKSWLALAITYSLGILFNFLTYGRIVFMSKLKGRFLPYVLVYCTLYAINFICLSLLKSTGISVLVSQIILIGPLAIVSFISLRIVFKDDGRGRKNEEDNNRDTLL